MQPNQTRQIIEGDRAANTPLSIAAKWGEKYGLDIQQSFSLSSFEGLSLQELAHLQGALASAMAREAAKYQ